MTNTSSTAEASRCDTFLHLPPRATLLLSLNQEPVSDSFKQSFSFSNYNLGDEIFAGNAANSQSFSLAYIVCKGKVRLLTGDRYSEITIERLEIDQCFGADPVLVTQPFSYRAVASSATVQIAQVPLSAMAAAFETNPQMRSYWLEQVQHRERLIFFRTLTALSDQPSHQLRQWLPSLKMLSVPAGERLRAIAPPEAGRYWLRSGSIESTEGDRLPAIGDSWGYPNNETAGRLKCDRTWVAQSDLRLYQLPASAWTLSKAFTPTLDAERIDNRQLDRGYTGQPPSQTPPLAKSKAHSDTAAHAFTRSTPALKNAAIAPKASPTVSFPKPPQRKVLDAFRQYPWVEQQSSSDCGAACLSMVSRYWGKRFPLNVLRERANVGRDGATLKSLARAAESIGFQARPVRASLGALATQKGPWIAHWEGRHYVVVYRVTDKHVIVADPALGKQAVPKQTFSRKWSGYGMLLEPTLDLKKTVVKQGSLGRYVQALGPYRGLIVQIVVVSLLIQCFGLLSPLFTQVILDRVVVQKSTDTLNIFVIGLLIFGLWGLIMSAVRQYLLSYFSNRLDVTLVSGFIRHTMSLPIRFFESRRVGDIITRVQENQKIQQFLIGQVVLAWLSFITGFVYLGLMLYYNWQLTMLVLLMVPPIVIITLGATPFLRRISREVFKEAADQNSALVEMIGGIATIKSTATEYEMRWRWENNLTRLMNARFRGQKFGIGLQSVSGLVNSVGSTLLLWYGATLVIQDQLTIGQFVAFNMMIGYVISPVLALAGLWDELQEIFISIERLNDVFETAPEESSSEALLMMPPLLGEVVFEGVTFRYNEESDRNTLQNLSFEIAAGATVAVVGRSGSGKSTLIKLLEGLYQPNQGRVLIDGHDIRRVSPASLRSQLGVVPQDCVLFSGTILENISLFRDSVPLSDVVKAAKLAEAHTFIQSLPLGYSTEVGERGATLSGGQRQRIAIARALLKKPNLLILDEATSALDTESERHFQQNLEHISREGTTFIIAHRLSTVRNADCILVLDSGVLVEQGTHAELLAANGLYYSLAQQQLDL